jgi:uncharacterized protein (DUF1697 family)
MARTKRESSEAVTASKPTVCVALIRGINVGGRNIVPMAELRDACGQAGCADVQTYIQSGNVIVRSAAPPHDLETMIEQVLKTRFNVNADVLVRSAAEWLDYIRHNPFEKESIDEPALVMLALCKATPRPDAVDQLRSRAASGEIIEQVGSAIWIHYPAGAGRSKLSPGLLDRFAGSPVTTRNWRTVLKLGELAGISAH